MPDIDFGILSDLIGTILHFGERMVVQRQLTAVVIVLLLTWLLAHGLGLLLGRHAQSWSEDNLRGGWKTVARYGLSIFRNILFPALALIALSYVQGTFQMRGWHEGLISEFILLFWVTIVYRFVIGVLYARLGQGAVRYHRRFLAPLFAILTLGWLLNHLIPIRQLTSVEVWSGFTTPITLGALLIATIGFYFWFDGSGVVQDFTRFVAKPFASRDSGTLEAALIIGRYVLVAIGAYIVFLVLGFDSTTLAFLTAGLSVGLGFGLKEIVGNLISGVMLLIDQSLRPGDVIAINDEIGVVQHVGIRATIVKTLNNVDVVVPNQTFLTSAVTTYTRTDEPIRMLIPVETSDEHTPQEVRDALLEVAKQNPLVLAEPAPNVFFISTGDSSRNYQLAVWYEDALKTVPLHSDLYFMIADEFDKRGIKPSTPQRDLNINSLMMVEPEERAGSASLQVAPAS